MEKSGQYSRNEVELLEGFEFEDFLDEKYLEQFMELIRDEINIESPAPATLLCTNYSQFSGDMVSGDAENEGGGSSGTTTRRNDKRNCKKVDRSRSLVSERRRRDLMKDNLYALRSLVPNITKMDKASIIADAVLYIQELQQKTKNLQNEIASIESSLSQADHDLLDLPEAFSCPVEVFFKPPGIKNILQMDVIQVEERGYYGKIICKKGQGIAAFLYKAMESLQCLQVHSSHIATVDQNYVFTFILNVGMDLSSVKVWVASAFLSQGFEFVI